MFIFAYINIYKRFSAFHLKLIERFIGVYSKEDISKIYDSIREVLIFFFYICFMLFFQTVYLLTKCFVHYYRNHSELLTLRVDDSIIVLLQISHIMMTVGVSLSIQKAFKA
jgi:hypothetical protein